MCFRTFRLLCNSRLLNTPIYYKSEVKSRRLAGAQTKSTPFDKITEALNDCKIAAKRKRRHF
jgi:hypothetical protein